MKVTHPKAGSPVESIDNKEITQPELTDEQIASIYQFGKEIDLPAGHVIYRQGELEPGFFVVLKGAVQVYVVDGRGHERILGNYTERTFLGETSIFGHHRAFDVRTEAGARILLVQVQDLKRMLAANPELQDALLEAFIRRRALAIRHSIGGAIIIGQVLDPRTLKLREFLFRNGYPYRIENPENPFEGGRTLAELLSLRHEDLPAVWIDKERLLQNPTVPQLASELGLRDEIPAGHVFDVAVVGAGPAGLSAGVYAASEGLDTIILESTASGGQAGSSSRIENYLGFPRGISGHELASRAQMQAIKFGAHIAIAREVVSVRKFPDGTFGLLLSDKTQVRCRTVIVATGAKYRKIDVPGYERFEGRGIYYTAMGIEAQLLPDDEAIVIGAGNSAGQAASFLSGRVSKVHLLVRGESLNSSMSTYLVDRIHASGKIQVYYRTELKAVAGKERLEEVRWESRNGKAWDRPVRWVFVMAGAIPNTAWLQGLVSLDQNGFVLTGEEAGIHGVSPYQTTEPGVFAVGDARADSVKRVASAVGEGSVVIQWVHKYLGMSLATSLSRSASNRKSA